ncbi:MAG: AsmA family protein [Alphaproteobacteria bacterium]|nr:AsmA family protein [Alphaproteobacteria bacterium]
MFKKIFIALSVLIILAFGGLSYYVSTIDWNLHKNKIAAQIEDITGKKIVIRGKIDLKILPSPYLSAKDIKIYNADDIKKEQPLAQIKEMVTHLSLWPLIKKSLVINKMNLYDAEIVVEFLNNGKTNWHSESAENQDLNISGVDIAFDSIALQNATLRIVNKTLDTDLTFVKLNADITGQSLVGPFRIDGNFVKDNTPAGFALNIGTMLESFSTSLNLVLTHPSSESYARFDGSILSNNSEIQGNFTIESQKPSTFLNTISGRELLPEKYNYPLASSIELLINPQQIDLSSVIVKYGDLTAGAGKVLIPLKSITGDVKKVEVSFEMTDIDLTPFNLILKEYLKKYDTAGTPFSFPFKRNFIADLTAMRAYCNDEPIRNFKLSADFIDDVLKINDLSGLLPGDTDLSVSGTVFENEKTLSYDLKTQAVSQDFAKLLTWLGLKPKIYAQATYRNARTAFDLSGNLNQIKLMPFSFQLDKSSLTGALGFKRDRRNTLFLSLESENINFDNYLPQPDSAQQKLSLADKSKLVLSGFKFLNNLDVRAELFVGLGIYNKLAFENAALAFDARDGVVNVEKLDIKKLASTSFSLQGIVSNLMANPSFENLRYVVKTSDFQALKDKFGLSLPAWPLFSQTRNFELKGVASGTFDNANVKTFAKLEKTNLGYAGRVYVKDAQTHYRGNLEIKTPDFAEFAGKIDLPYKPQNLSASLLSFKADVEGTFGNWEAKNADMFIGSNKFSGDFSYVKTGQKPLLKANANVNVFEFDRFIYAPQKTAVLPKTKTAFLSQPVWDNAKIDYDVFQDFNLQGNFKAKTLSYKSAYINDAEFELDVQDGVVFLKNLTAKKDSCNIAAELTLNTNESAKTSGVLSLKNCPTGNIGGSVYAFDSPNMSLEAQYQANALSQSDFMKTLEAKLLFDLSDVKVKGIDLPAIENDLAIRERSENLENIVRQNLIHGETAFSSVGAQMDIDNGQYKISDAFMRSNAYSVDFQGSGSLLSWQTDTEFDMTFEYLKDNVLPIFFGLKGSLENPDLTIDVSELKNRYDVRFAELERRAAEEKNARIQALNERMDVVQDRVYKQINLINTEIKPRLKRYKSFNNETIANTVYDSVGFQSDDMLKTLKEMAQISETDFNQKDIDKISVQINILEPSIEALIARLDENYLLDMKLHASRSFQSISEIHEDSLEKSENYQNALISYAKRLSQLGSLVVLDQLDIVKTKQANIESSISKIADLYIFSHKTRNELEKESGIAVVNKHYQDMEKTLEEAKEEFEKLDKTLEELFLYIQDLVYFEQTGQRKTRSPSPKTQQEEDLFGEDDVPAPLAEDVITTQQAQTLEIEPQPQEQAPQTGVEEKKPLLVENTDDYATKVSSGGTVSKKATASENEKSSKPAAQKSLLRPIEGNLTPAGSVKRK